MKRKLWLRTSILTMLFTFLFQSAAFADFGFGFGGLGRRFFGGWGVPGPRTLINVWRNWNRDTSPNESSPPQQPVQYYQPVQQPVASTGVLEGKIQMTSKCPTQPEKVCLVTQPMGDVTVTATPTDKAQWVTAQPDEQGNYRLSLPPGNYQVKAQNPYSKAETSQPVTVQPGESTKLDMGLYSESY